MEHYPNLIALGKALYVENGKARLTPSSTATAYAAGVIGDKGGLDKLILSGGETLGSKHPSEAKLMREFIYEKISRDVADFATLEDKSKTTLGNVNNIINILKGNISGKIGLLTVGYHLPRATKTFRGKGFTNLISLSSEDFLEGSYKTQFFNYLGSHEGKLELIKEDIIKFVTFFPLGTEILEFIATKFTRTD